MADERQRELERKALAGDVEAEAKLLLERVRSGELTEERLKLAAYCGHGPAEHALTSEAPADSEHWLYGLDAHGTPAWCRAAAAMLPRFLAFEQPSLEASHGDDPLEDQLVLHALSMLESCLVEQTAASQAAFMEAIQDLNSHDGDRPSMSRNLILNVSDWVLRSSQVHLVPDELSSLLDASGEDGDRERDHLVVVAKQHLIPWALGTGDPIRMRVAKRGEVEILPEDLRE